MNETPSPTLDTSTPEILQLGFLLLLPRIEAHARIAFRHIRCPQSKDDAVSETVAVAWKWYVRAAQRGKDVAEFVSTFATYAARAVRSGRRLCAQEPAKDVLSARARRLKCFTVAALPQGSTLDGNVFDEALHDNTQTPVPEQVQFRCDFPAWRRTRADRDRRVIDELMAGERTFDVARRFGMSPGRVSQLRREFHEDWQRFCDCPDAEAGIAAPA